MTKNVAIEDHKHCLNCFNGNRCQNNTKCPIIDCTNRQCPFKLHLCKLDEHLNEVCLFQSIDCINKCNGCKLKIKRADMGPHLNCCVASVIRCSSFKLRNLVNKNEKFDKLKWPCPVQVQLEQNQTLTESFLALNENKNVNINDVLLKQDYASIQQFAEANPLMFHRLYGYLIGLDVSTDFSRGRFGFLRKILKNVKSKVFADIEAENCIILNDEIGCLMCQYRVRHLEMKRFRDMRSFENRIKFYSVLGELDDYATFIEEKIYANPEFIHIYSKVYPNKVKNQLEEELEDLSNEELSNKLIKNNKEIMQVLELNPALKVNITKEMSCESFIELESYRLRETTYTCECDQLLRRDEFCEHYELFHDFLLPNADQIDVSCPYRQYGCNFFQQRFEFIFGTSVDNRYLNVNYPLANLVQNDLNKCLSFRFETRSTFNNYWDENNNSNSKNKNENENNLMDLPFEVMYIIIDNLDSISLFNLSMTCKVYVRPHAVGYHLCDRPGKAPREI